MAEQKYLIALALAEQNNKRIMPIGGKTISGDYSLINPPKRESEKIILDLLLRIFKRSNEGYLKTSNKDNGLLIAIIGFDELQKSIPIIKSNWINSSKTDQLISSLSSITENLWSVRYEKHEGIIFTNLKE